MMIQQVIADLNGCALAEEQLAARMYALAHWQDTNQRGSLPWPEIPPEHSIAIREINIAGGLSERAVSAAEVYLPGTFEAWRRSRSNLDRGNLDVSPGSVSSAVGHNMRGTVLFLQKTAQALRSLAAQPTARSASLLAPPVSFWLDVLRQSEQQAGMVRGEATGSEEFILWCRRTEEAVEVLFGSDSRSLCELRRLLCRYRPHEQVWETGSLYPDMPMIAALLRDLIGLAEKAVASGGVRHGTQVATPGAVSTGEGE